jgi:hypothetical protein
MSVTFSLGMSRFDTGETKMGIIERISEVCVYILGFPIVSAFLALPTKGIPDFIEWISFFMNSAIWGVALTMLFFRLTNRPTKKSHQKSELTRGGNAIGAPLFDVLRKNSKMGYDIHITRKKFHYDEEGPTIAESEWKEFVENSEEFAFDKQDGGSLQAVWKEAKENGCSYDDAWLDWFEGSIFTKNPDLVLIEKMIELSKHFQAKVQGDDGEVYTTPTDYHQEEEYEEHPTESPKRSFLSRLFGK